MSSASSTGTGCDRPSTRKMISLTRQKLAHPAPARSSARASGSTSSGEELFVPDEIKRGPFRRASPLLPVRLGLLPEPERVVRAHRHTEHAADRLDPEDVAPLLHVASHLRRIGPSSVAK